MDILIRVNLPYFTSYERGEPQFEQNFPLFFVPQEQIQSAEGLGEPQLEQKFPLFTAPQEQVHPPAAGAACWGAGC